MSQISPAPSVPLPESPRRTILRAAGLNKVYRMGDSVVSVLRDAALDVAAGEFIAIEGRSGSGKSTLLHVLGALDAVDTGRIEFEGNTYTRYTPAERNAFIRAMIHPTTIAVGWIVFFASNLVAIPGLIFFEPLYWACVVVNGLAIATLFTCLVVRLVLIVERSPEERAAARLRNRDFGFVFQFYHLLPELNVLENAMLSPMIQHSWFNFFGQRRALRERAIAVLHELGMSHRLTHRPNQLSGGERQRVAIARALMNEPKVLFADEPTGNLDAETGKQIMAVLERLHREQGQTIVMVTHDRGLARKTDRVLVLRNGKLEPAES